MLPSALGPGGRHRELIRQADVELDVAQKRIENARDFIKEVRESQDAIEAFNAEQAKRPKAKR